MVLSRVTHIVLYRPYRADSKSPKEVALFGDGREAMSFEGSHRRVCSSIDTLKVDCELTDELLKALQNGV
jgi:hypothetical protein